MTATFDDPADTPTDPPPSESTPEDIALSRRFCTWLEYWRRCATRACHRVHACTGDPIECYLRRTMDLSDVAKIWVRAGIAAIDRGLTARAAAGVADLALLHHVKTADRLPQHPPRRRRRRPNDGDARTARPGCGNKA